MVASGFFNEVPQRHPPSQRELHGRIYGSKLGAYVLGLGSTEAGVKGEGLLPVAAGLAGIAGGLVD